MEIAKTYDDIGVSCFSILTDEKYFNGSLNDLINKIIINGNTRTTDKVIRRQIAISEGDQIKIKRTKKYQKR